MRVKYPRTFHLPQSLGATSDDKIQSDLSLLLNNRCVITEKMDGENTTIYNDGFHSRSLDSTTHPSRTRIAKLQSEIGYNIPSGMRICGENLYAKHSIEYTDLPSYFLAFSVWDNNLCLSWDETILWLQLFGVNHVPVIFNGILTEDVIQRTIDSVDVSRSEGFVIRLHDEFNLSDFSKCVVKWVRANHVTTDKHWMFKDITPNRLSQWSTQQS